MIPAPGPQKPTPNLADAALLGGRSGDRDVGGRLYRVQRMAQFGGSQELGLFGSHAHRSSYWDWTIPFDAMDRDSSGQLALGAPICTSWRRFLETLNGPQAYLSALLLD